MKTNVVDGLAALGVGGFIGYMYSQSNRKVAHDTPASVPHFEKKDVIPVMTSERKLLNTSGSTFDVARTAGHYFRYLKHETSYENIEKILESGGLQPRDILSDLPSVCLLFSNRDDFAKKGDLQCALVFDLGILDSRDDYHITNRWTYGNFYEKFTHIDILNKKHLLMSAKPNDHDKFIEVLDIMSTQDEIEEPNEVVFKNKVDFRYLKFIYVPDDLWIKRREMLESLIQSNGISTCKSYPGIKIESVNPLCRDKPKL